MATSLSSGLDAFLESSLNPRDVSKSADNNLDSNQDSAEELENSQILRTLPIEQICPDKQQPRRYFDPEKLEKLAQSIQEHGILEPLIVRPLTDDTYELICGDRRFKASQKIGLKEVPVNVLFLDDNQVKEIRLIENLQREDLNAFEETEGILELLAIKLEMPTDSVVSLLYKMANEEKGNSNQNVLVSSKYQIIQNLFDALGRLSWQSFVSSRLPLLKLFPDIQQALRNGLIEYTKAKFINKIKDQSQRVDFLEQVVSQNWSLRTIKEKICALNNTQTSTEENQISTENGDYPKRVTSVLHQIKKMRLWSDPNKRSKLEPLITQLEQLIATN
ncbi:ParB/RepB/Spo0J family partition protein [Rivularia sp. UHCC 0363]|uniref:ParB/RepB/Spo0J family partition protein n=1 Tax=Rivularia sp. UHCC 0363 TaxID=3110244 RepID=UPI002B1F3F39|nr:ParB/RepB/Spo0J family partition protein [Rivularia sp. UHCC 0363]MEA5599005.1 ParB/RepB/Spo0J family partition protein [Rivularia sp. UHCC 0363]